MFEWTRSLTGSSGRRSRSLRHLQVPERDGRADVDHPLDLALGHPECGGGVGHAVEPFTVCADPRVGTGSQRGASPGGALCGDEPLVGVGVASGEDGGEVGALHDTDQPGACGSSAVPPAGFLASVGVIPLGSTANRRRRRARGRGLGWRLEVADDRVDGAGRVGSAAAERRDRELHPTPPTGGRAGSPKGNPQTCDRWTCRSAPT